MIIAGFVTSWFVAKDATDFGFIQMTVALVLFGLVVFIIAFWPSGWAIKLGRLRKPR